MYRKEISLFKKWLSQQSYRNKDSGTSWEPNDRIWLRTCSTVHGAQWANESSIELLANFSV